MRLQGLKQMDELMSFARTYLDFERPIAELDGKIEQLLELNEADVDVSAEVEQLRQKSATELEKLYKNCLLYTSDAADD